MQHQCPTAAQLARSALLVNPYDVEGVADALHRAYNMGTEERRVRMKRLRRSIRNQDVFWWVDAFLRSAITKDLRAFPQLGGQVADPVPEYSAVY